MPLVTAILNSVGEKLLFRVLKRSLYYERILLATYLNLCGEFKSPFFLHSLSLDPSRRNLDRIKKNAPPFFPF